LVHRCRLAPRHGAPPSVPQSVLKLLPMSPDRSVTYVWGPYRPVPNNSMQRTALRAAADAERLGRQELVRHAIAVLN